MSDSVAVTVRFNPPSTEKRRVTFDKSNIRFDTTTGMVIFTLKVKPDSEAAQFPSNPIQWVDANLQPITQPPEATVSRTADMATVTIMNAPQGKTKFRFYVIVLTNNGEFFGTDPTIVTMPPD